MSEKKGVFGGLFGGKKKSSCCDMEIIEETEIKKGKKKTGCCDMEIIEEDSDSQKATE